MPRSGWRWLATAWAALWFSVRAFAAPIPVDVDRLERTTQYLSGLGHRLSGSANGRAAGDHILASLKQAGFDSKDILVQRFEVTQLRNDECWIERDGQRVVLQPLRPNGLALPVTPAEGLSVEAVYLRRGSDKDLAGKDLGGRIAVLDFDSGLAWLEAAARGASAIVFVGPASQGPESPKWSNAHAPIPRFYIDRAQAEQIRLLDGGASRLKCRMGFERVEGRNIVAVVTGTQTPQKAVAIACAYDTFGVTPFAAPGNRQAANVAALIELAAHLRQNPSKRTVAIAFFDNDAQDLTGQMLFHFARTADPRAQDADPLEQLIRSRTAERSVLAGRLEALADGVGVIERRAKGSEALSSRELLLARIEAAYDEVSAALSRARIARVELERFPKGSQADAPSLDKQIAAHDAEKSKLGTLRLRMVEGKSGSIDGLAAEIRRRFDTLLERLRSELQNRLSELDREQSQLASWRELSIRLSGREFQAMVFLDLLPGDAPWTVTVPASANNQLEAESGGSIALVANQSLSQWIQKLGEAEAGRRWKLMASMPGNVWTETRRWRISGQASVVVEIGSTGSVWDGRGLRGEQKSVATALAGRVAEAGEFVGVLLDRAELGEARIPPRVNTFNYSWPQWDGVGHTGCSVRRYGGRDVEAEWPVAGATVFVWPSRDEPGNRVALPLDQWGARLATTDAAGGFPLIVDGSSSGHFEVSAASFDASGRINGITQLHPGGNAGAAGNWNKPGYFQPRTANRLAMFERPTGVSLIHVRDFTDEIRLRSVRVLDAVSEAPPDDLNVSLSGDVLAVYSSGIHPLKVLVGSQVLLNNASGRPAGSGYPLMSGSALDARALAAGDAWRLNEERLSNLRRHGVLQDSLDRLHAEAERYLDDARTGRGSTAALSGAKMQASLAYSGQVYAPVRTVTNDLIQAVVILLLMAIPAAFAVERLVFGSANVYRQIGVFAAIFAAVFAVLYVVHPAFQFAAFPVVVLLAFVIIILSSMVIFVMWGKFEYEIRNMQGVVTASHRSTRNRRATIAAAVAQGIASMRRRPLRTVLTATTIILLTFSVLFFSSFSTEGAIRQVPVGPGPQSRQINIRATPDRTTGLDAATVRTLRTLWADAAGSFARHWGLSQEDSVLAARLPNGHVIGLAGWATLAAEEVKLQPEIAAAMVGDMDGFLRQGGIFLPPTAYEQLAKTGGSQEVEFLGRRWVLRGTFDVQKLREIRTADGGSVLPPAIEPIRRMLRLQYPHDRAAAIQKLKEMELGDFPPLDAEMVAIISAPQATDGNLAVQSVVLLPADDRAAERIAGEASILLRQPVTLCAGGQVSRVLYATQASFSGFSKLFVPLLLGGLIIFSTMLSSVTDRAKEIYTFSALGLAPKHIATLFFAEATVYALIGGMGGYLFSQAFGKAMQWAAGRGWVEAPAMNYSSTNAMMVILVIMAVVLVSTIYPAMRAARSANAGIQRRWKLPEPEGDRYAIRFPFTVSSYELTGLIAFLEEFLMSHRDKSVGNFAAADVVVDRQNDRFSLGARIWLRPFDQGVSQTFELATLPSDIEGIDEVHIRMERLSGAPVIWKRSNKVFIGEIREQFIFWRTIPEDAREHYHKSTAERFAILETAEAQA